MRLGGDQDALGVPAVDDVAEAHALFADQVVGRHLEVLDEQLGGVVVEHRLDRPDLDLAALDGLRAGRPGRRSGPRVLSVSSS